jgi:hypothetical protein
MRWKLSRVKQSAGPGPPPFPAHAHTGCDFQLDLPVDGHRNAVLPHARRHWAHPGVPKRADSALLHDRGLDQGTGGWRSGHRVQQLTTPVVAQVVRPAKTHGASGKRRADGFLVAERARLHHAGNRSSKHNRSQILYTLSPGKSGPEPLQGISSKGLLGPDPIGVLVLLSAVPPSGLTLLNRLRA